MVWEGRGLHPTGRCRSSGAWAERAFVLPKTPGCWVPTKSPLWQKQALIGFHKAEEMRPVTSRDNDLQTKEETCTEAVFSFTWGISGQRNVNTDLWLGAGSWGEGWQGRGEIQLANGDCCRHNPCPCHFLQVAPLQPQEAPA